MTILDHGTVCIPPRIVTIVTIDTSVAEIQAARSPLVPTGTRAGSTIVNILDMADGLSNFSSAR